MQINIKHLQIALKVSACPLDHPSTHSGKLAIDLLDVISEQY